MSLDNNLGKIPKLMLKSGWNILTQNCTIRFLYVSFLSSTPEANDIAGAKFISSLFP